MKILGLDFETTGVDTATCLPIEFACQTYDTKTRERGKPFSILIWQKDWEPITDEIRELTGIQQEELSKGGVHLDVFLQMAIPLIRDAEMLSAYNAQFDREILYRICDSFGLRKPHQPWLCMRNDFPWPERMMKCQKLQHRALDIGLPMDNREKHRALADVTTMWDVMDLYRPEEVLEFASQPWRYLWADIAKPWLDDGKQRDSAKGLGYSWEQCPGDTRRFDKKWVKRVKEGDVAHEIHKAKSLGKFPFQVHRLA